MAQATRPIFVPLTCFPFVQEVSMTFAWYPGFAKTQVQKCIAALHQAATQRGIGAILEISSKSSQPLGMALSAFNLTLTTTSAMQLSVENAFQGSKVFEHGGPYVDLYTVSSRAAKTDQRLRTSGQLRAFQFFGEAFPIRPLTVFYDWLYITALAQHPDLADPLCTFEGFSDIVFNPHKSVNCQAHAAALFVALRRLGALPSVVANKAAYFRLMCPETLLDVPTDPGAQQLPLLDHT